MGEAERAGSRLRETRGRVRLDLGVEWMICNRGVWVWDRNWEWESVEEKVKVRGAGKGGGATENGCGSKGPQVRSPGGRLVVAGACLCFAAERSDSASPRSVTDRGVGVGWTERKGA